MYCSTITKWLFSLLYLIIVMTGHTTLTLPLTLPLERSHLHDLFQLPNRKVNANIMLFPMVVAITFTIYDAHFGRYCCKYISFPNSAPPWYTPESSGDGHGAQIV